MIIHSRDNIRFRVNPGGNINGRLRVSGDKSISHRALILGAIADGVTIIKGFLQSEDTLATARVFQQMGVDIQYDDDSVYINGVGLNGLNEPKQVLDLGNSGTSVRLLTGLFSGQSFNVELVGDATLMKRPMRRVVTPLLLMHAKISCSEKGTLPIKITGRQKLVGIEYEMPVASAQVKSCLLLAGLYAGGTTTIIEKDLTRDHTERILSTFSHPVIKNGNKISITKADKLTATEIVIPSDFSSSAFFIVAATVTPGSDVILENVGINPTRNAMLKIMRLMGAKIELLNEREQSGEPIADLHIKSNELKGINIPEKYVTIAIDEFPAILIAAACAKGTTQLINAAELRVKESDRIQAMLDGFVATGIKATATVNGLIVTGGKFNGGVVESYGDHRIAMAFAVAGMLAKEPIMINDCGNVATSFPDFVKLARLAGMDIYCE